MKVETFTTSVEGGAGLAAKRLHEGLLGEGVQSRVWTAQGIASDERECGNYFETWQEPSTASNGWLRRQLQRVRYAIKKNRLRFQMFGMPSGHELFSLATIGQATELRRELLRSDVLHLHWIARFIDFASFFASIPDDFPIVWTLHDMYPFTGGCHYSDGCERFIQECGSCPQLARSWKTDCSRVELRVKQCAMRGKNLTIVAPSRWMIQQAQRSEVLSSAGSYRHIPLGFDTTQLKARDRSEARRKLGLPLDATLVGFGAAGLDNQRKGLRHLLNALSQLSDRGDIVGVVFGGGDADLQSETSVSVRPLGFVDNVYDQSFVYSACDIVAMPSLQDNSPQIGLEALACSVPVVGSNVGGIPEYVVPGETGLLSESSNVDDLARQIAWLADHPVERQQMGVNGRQYMLREHTLERQATRYVELYREITAKRSPRVDSAA